MRKKVFTDKFYTHFDVKKRHNNYEKRIMNEKWVSHHGFYPFIHFTINFKKYVRNSEGLKEKKEKIREIYYAAHIDRFIYQYYGNELNKKYNKYAKANRFNKASIAYRNCFKGKCNIDFAKEVFEFIVKQEEAFVFIADFSKFFDMIDHRYLKERLMVLNNNEKLNEAEYAIYKNLTKFAFVEAEDIENEKGKLRRDMKTLDKYFDTKEFQNFKKKHLKTNDKSYQIPQGSSISAIYANVYLIDFDRLINDYVTSKRGLYRRYCDDIMIVIPISKLDRNNEVYKEYAQYIYDVKDSVPNLILNEDKTEMFFYSNGEIEKISGESNLINYLGFTFDGKKVKIRDKSLFKFYCRAYKKIKSVKFNNNPMHYMAGKKAVYEKYTHLGAKKGYGNFITYAYKAHDKFDSSNLLESEIRNQVKRHWYKIEKRLKA